MFGEMKDSNLGIIRSVRGSVVDVFFPKRLPGIYSTGWSWGMARKAIVFV